MDYWRECVAEACEDAGADHEEAILAKAPDDYFREKYRAWRAVFEWASDNGAVDFH